MNLLTVDRISKSYGEKQVIKDLSFALEKGKIATLLGESGCGKTTALRCIAGFESPASGSIGINGRTVSSATLCLPPEKRQVGMVFQDYALFSHLSVAKNISFGLGHLSRRERQRRTGEMLELVNLAMDADKRPHALSGGQQQRVALARALAPGPELLLLDEPFSNLDVMLRERLSLEVGRIIRELGISALLVTHNQNEAFAMGDRIGIMHGGRLEQWGTPHDLYHTPHTPFVAEFVGEGTFITGKPVADNQVETALGTLSAPPLLPRGTDRQYRVLIRPEHIVHDEHSPVRAVIIRKHFRGAQIQYTLKLRNGEEILSLMCSRCNHPVGAGLGIRTCMTDSVVFPVADGHNG